MALNYVTYVLFLLQATSTIDSLMIKIRAHNTQIKSMTPLTDHAAHIFTLLQFVGPRFQFHLSEFLALFKEDVRLHAAKLRECLVSYHEGDAAPTQKGVAGEGMAGQEDDVTVVQKDDVAKSISTQRAINNQLEEMLKTLNHTILEKASRCVYCVCLSAVCLSAFVCVYVCVRACVCACVCEYKI